MTVLWAGKGYDKRFIHPALSAWLYMNSSIHNSGSRLRVGSLVSFQVIAAGPDKAAYLVEIGSDRLMGLLPREYASREYSPGEYGWAAVFEIKSGWIILSRTSPHFIKKTLECLLRDFLDEHGIRLKRVARLKEAPFCKVGCKTELSQEELSMTFQSWGSLRLKEHLSSAVTLVSFSRDLVEYSLNALYPAPLGAVHNVSYLEASKKVIVKVEPSMVGRFLGRSCWNVATASKLTGVEIEIK